MAIRILSDENCVGQVEAIFSELNRLGYVELLEVELLTWSTAGLAPGTDDEPLWRYCQENDCLLITGNRTGDDGEEALELIIRDLVGPTHLPVLTVGNLKRVLRNRRYCTACAQRLADIIFDLQFYRGITRLYLP
jgi:hypothetical protein